MSLRPPLALYAFCRLHDSGDSEGGSWDACLVHPREPAARLPHLLRDVRVHGGNCCLSSHVSYKLFSCWALARRALPFPGPDDIVLEPTARVRHPLWRGKGCSCAELSHRRGSELLERQACSGHV